MKKFTIISTPEGKMLRTYEIGGRGILEIPYIGNREPGSLVSEGEIGEVTQYKLGGEWRLLVEGSEFAHYWELETRTAYTDAEPDERWKDIPGYEGFYQISNRGRVKSLSRIVDAGNRKYSVQEKILTPQKAANKTFVRLTIDAVSDSIMVEKTVNELFGHNEKVKTKPPFTVTNVRPLVNQMLAEEISFSRFVEILNEMSNADI